MVRGFAHAAHQPFGTAALDAGSRGENGVRHGPISWVFSAPRQTGRGDRHCDDPQRSTACKAPIGQHQTAGRPSFETTPAHSAAFCCAKASLAVRSPPSPPRFDAPAASFCCQPRPSASWSMPPDVLTPRMRSSSRPPLPSRPAAAGCGSGDTLGGCRASGPRAAAARASPAGEAASPRSRASSSRPSACRTNPGPAAASAAGWMWRSPRRCSAPCRSERPDALLPQARQPPWLADPGSDSGGIRHASRATEG